MIRLLSLTIRAFRGVPDELNINLSSPITLIYAPNGTGKTTICDACEWLLTGIVKRLEGLSETDQLRCQFAEDGVQTSVAGHAIVDGEHIEIERTLAQCRWKVGNGKWAKVSQSDLLQKLAPSAVEEGVHRNHANPSRQTWIRGTRFLAGETLATLLDSDGDALSGRQRIFADMLGVGHLLETERQLRGYLDEISHSQREQQSKVDLLRRNIQQQEARTSKENAQSKEQLTASALGCFNRATSLLRLVDLKSAEASPANLTSAIAIVRADLDGRTFKWNEKRQAELQLSTDWRNRENLLVSISADSERNKVLISEGEANGNLLVAINSDREGIVSQLAQLKAALTQIEDRERGLGAAHAQAHPLVDYYVENVPSHKFTMGDINPLIDLQKTNALVAAGHVKLRQLADGLSAFEKQQEELANLQDERASLAARAPSAEVVDELSKKSDLEKERLRELAHKHTEIAGPIDQIRHLAEKVLEHLHEEEGDCPLCGHDWKDNTQLRSAIIRTVSDAPLAVSRVQEEIRSIEGVAENTRLQILAATRALSELVKLDERIRVTQSAVTDFSNRLREYGLSATDKMLPEKIEYAVTASRVIPALRNFRAAIELAVSGRNISVAPDISVGAIYSSVRPALLAEANVLRSKIEEMETNLKAVTSRYNATAEAAKKLDTEVNVLSRRIKINSQRLQTIKTAWQVLGGKSDSLTDAELLTLSENLRKDHDDHRMVAQLLHQAEAIIAEIASIGELESLRKQLNPVIAERDRLNSYAEAASTLKAAYESYRQNHTQQQMASFVKVISALFTRMQCNLVYDDIASGDVSAPLSWRAIAEEYSLNPEGLFSQGQRQDFALSIFLAHARGLGGTFFLDEPMSHLDDLNRVALLDVFRALTLEEGQKMSFVLTTANKQLVRHMAEKFSRLAPADAEDEDLALNIVSLEGNPRSGVKQLNAVEHVGS